MRVWMQTLAQIIHGRLQQGISKKLTYALARVIHMKIRRNNYVHIELPMQYLGKAILVR